MRIAAFLDDHHEIEKIMGSLGIPKSQAPRFDLAFGRLRRGLVAGRRYQKHPRRVLSMSCRRLIITEHC
jgi:hypothetical protein